MSQQRLFLIQTLLEAIIPVIGYFEWGWDLSFILLFYFLDAVLAFGIFLAKGNKRLTYSGDSGERTLFTKHSPIGFFLFAAAITGIAVSITFLRPELDWWKRIIHFLTYKEWGIGQGYILIPLIVLNGVMVYRQQFLMTARYRTLEMSAITKPFLVQGLVLTATAGILLVTTALIQFPEEILIAGFIMGTSLYRFLVIRRA
ncbi:MAG: hypothetical protein A3D31_13320 [Candidatus Fluviicola riflensis]|nr:MAG: hypothetical protein CHH17_17755 [Candidatus Fluviicola riflensis]OGS77959.1 MAG: hypothetical protein A3D31_13320 [Candidatus Fluviicola riflensis]OGS85024.1 MAG: hypothetical protein A2724_10255 [Fluviicola sp. RIFCSPHIGHO2_01_FULL_43_53]OGS89296.1 MAG: hypothetical protein A3E30_04560 [Fluviicola sp. RIFCSPHIGHO2_12_FULL_43_24]